jgi:hypothetical protein
MNNCILVYIIPFLITSCSELLGAKKLGNKIYWDDKIIVVTKSDEYKGVGLCIIPPTIEKVKKDEKFIIVQTLNGKKEIKYWLIDKRIEGKELNYVEEDSSYWSYYKYSNVYGPLDSVEFLNLKAQKDIKINW